MLPCANGTLVHAIFHVDLTSIPMRFWHKPQAVVAQVTLRRDMDPKVVKVTHSNLAHVALDILKKKHYVTGEKNKKS